MNGDKPLQPWLPVYGVTVRVYYDPARKPHANGSVLTPAAGSTIGPSAKLTAKARSAAGILRVDFLGRYLDVSYEGDGVYDRWHGHLFHGQLTHHLGSTEAGGAVTWDTSWVPDQPRAMELAALVTDRAGVVAMTPSVGGLVLSRPGIAVELCRPLDVPRSFTACQYGTWIVPGVRTQKFRVEGDLARMIDARYAIASWGDFASGHGYALNGVPLEDKPAGENWLYDFSVLPIRPLSALRAGENTFSTVVGEGRLSDVYMPGVQVLVRYRKGSDE